MRLGLATAALVIAGAVFAQDPSGSRSLSGSVRLDKANASPIPYAYVGVLSKSFEMAGQGVTDTAGRFTIELAAPLPGGYLMVQPPPRENPEGLGIYSAQPRIFVYRGESQLDLRLPPAGCIVLKAYGANGQLMRWGDFRARGTFGGQFMYLTSPDGEALPAVAWPVFDRTARDQGQPRELGLPALAVKPGSGYVPQVLYWDVPEYGRLLLRADNEGMGFSVDEPGDGCILEWNVELARTAVHQLAETSQPSASALIQRLHETRQLADGRDRAKAADAILAEALRTRDALAVDSAREAVANVRMGNVTVRVVDAEGKPIPDATIRIVQQTSDFLFGVFEGSPYNAAAFERARDAGFNLATVLLGWGWTDILGGGVDRSAIEKTFGIRALNKLGYTVKAHGVVWLQGYGILPDRALAMDDERLLESMLAQESSLLNAFGNEIAIWEAMNEPNVTNVVDLPRRMVYELLDKSARQVGAAKDGLLSLVNGAHEGDYGCKFALYDPDGSPSADWNTTYSAFLKEAIAQGSMRQTAIIGLQYYPGFRFNESFGGLQGPATTPAWLVDLIDRYAAFDRPIHITEFSVPSSYQPEWTSGYWREPWTEETQADYAEMIFTLAFGHPHVRSISWWDVMDTKSSVITGGLLHPDGSPKPAFERLSTLLHDWTQHSATGVTNSRGEVQLSGFGGGYIIEAGLPGGETRKETVHISERETVAVELSVGAPP